jgi:excinuclease ABC subunit B
MEAAIDETNRRREKQVAYNKANGVDPQPLRKKIADITEMLAREDESTEELLKTWQQADPKAKRAPVPGLSRESGKHAAELAGLPSHELAELVQQLTEQMHNAAAELQFELAARLRDEIQDLKRELRQMVEAGAR